MKSFKQIKQELSIKNPELYQELMTEVQVEINDLKEMLGLIPRHKCQCKKPVVLEIVEGIKNIYTEAYEFPACFDIKANEDVTIPAGQHRLVKTGIKMNIPEGYWVKLHSRSGLSAKHGIEVGAGIIDEPYIGEIGVVLHNFSDVDFVVEIGDRIAQFELRKKEQYVIRQGDKLKDSARGANGFGSSGR